MNLLGIVRLRLCSVVDKVLLDIHNSMLEFKLLTLLVSDNNDYQSKAINKKDTCLSALHGS